MVLSIVPNPYILGFSAFTTNSPCRTFRSFNSCVAASASTSPCSKTNLSISSRPKVIEIGGWCKERYVGVVEVEVFA